MKTVIGCIGADTVLGLAALAQDSSIFPDDGGLEYLKLVLDELDFENRDLKSNVSLGREHRKRTHTYINETELKNIERCVGKKEALRYCIIKAISCISHRWYKGNIPEEIKEASEYLKKAIYIAENLNK